MPHLDALTIRVTFARNGQSRFARPVAAITERIRRWLVAPWCAQAAPRIKQDLEVRALEERFGRAADIAEFTRMERDFEARDASAWNWR
jgi:hypothetical protein